MVVPWVKEFYTLGKGGRTDDLGGHKEIAIYRGGVKCKRFNIIAMEQRKGIHCNEVIFLG